MKTICVLGAGTYGSYIAYTISKKYPAASIQIVEVGDETIKDEKEAGFLSRLKGGAYNGASKGRYFGFGGTSARWGGQLLFFSKQDCPGDDAVREIKQANINYKQKVLRRFFKSLPEFQEYEIEPGLFFKQGLWLKLNNRNLFNYFKLRSVKNIKIIGGSRLVRINRRSSAIASVTITRGNANEDITADVYYLACGAFESVRILGASGLIDLEQSTKGFSDHASLRCFTIHSNKATLLGVDFSYRFLNQSLITSRLIGDINGTSFFVQPVFNEKFLFFQFLKNLLFKGKFSVDQLVQAGPQFLHIFSFVATYFFKKKLYIYKDWDINIDIELDGKDNFVKLSEEKDQFGEKGIDIQFGVPETTIQKIHYAKKTIRNVLERSNVKYSEHNAEVSITKLEDAYHPYNLYSSSSLQNNYHPYDNLYVFHTGILSRAGGINPTASIFCLIEKHIAEDLNR